MLELLANRNALAWGIVLSSAVVLMGVGCAEDRTPIGADRIDAGSGDDDDDDDVTGDDDDDDDDDDDPVACDATTPCPATAFCDVDGADCGGRLGEGTCAPRPDVCPADCSGVCGCDGLDYCNACTAQLLGVDVSNDTRCLTRTDECSGQRVRVTDPSCDAVLGWYWSGMGSGGTVGGCVELSGCGCAGADCDALFADRASCEVAYADCLAPDGCDALDARPEGDCDAIVGVTWDGRSCVEMTGCSCVGTDCAIATRLDLATCETAYARCGPGR